jgi:hypothetical protein
VRANAFSAARNVAFVVMNECTVSVSTFSWIVFMASSQAAGDGCGWMLILHVSRYKLRNPFLGPPRLMMVRMRAMPGDR